MEKYSLTSLIPALFRGSIVLRALVIAQAVAIVLVLAPKITEDPWVQFGLVSLFVQWTMLTTLALLAVMQSRGKLFQGVNQGLAVMLVLLAVTSVISIVAHSLAAGTLWQHQQPLTWFLLKNVCIAFIVGIIAMQFFILHTDRSRRIAAQSRAELDALQARIQPHFLFNSLNTIAELTHQDANLAEQALLDLSDLMRAALHAGDINTLSEEIALTKRYLALEQLRLGERLQSHWVMPEKLPQLMMPALIIQPLIENAVRYGVEPALLGGKIHVYLELSKKTATLIITNACSAAISKSKGNGVALDNIRQRLLLHYNSEASLTTAYRDGLFRVKLVLPLGDGGERAA